MHTGRNYSVRETLVWTRRETAIFLVLSAAVTGAYELLEWRWLAVPWVPVALVGTAVAFITGFKNNASYGRLWEARQVWGGLVNTSRIWTTQVLDFPDPGRAAAADVDLESGQRRLVYRGIAFLHALRHQLREPRSWESMERSYNVRYLRNYEVAEWDEELSDVLEPLLSSDELERVLAAKNRATAILALQSKQIGDWLRLGVLGEFERTAMAETLARYFDDQGRSERIKNFPYPRQFATLNLIFIWLFILAVPSGLLREFESLGPGYVWLTIPASVILSWVFHTIDKIGEASENPFEGGPNDVPITAMTRTIEIDLRDLLGEKELPPALEPVNLILT